MAGDEKQIFSKFIIDVKQINHPYPEDFKKMLQQRVGWSEREKVISLLAEAHSLLLKGNPQLANRQLVKLSLGKVPEELRAVVFVLNLQARLALADYAGVISLVNKWEAGLNLGKFAAEVSASYFFSAVKLGLFETARQRYELNKEHFVNEQRFAFLNGKVFEQMLAWFKLYNVEKFTSLASQWFSAEELFGGAVKRYYFAQNSLCNPYHWKEDTPNKESPTQRATRLMARSGEFADVSEFVFASVGLGTNANNMGQTLYALSNQSVSLSEEIRNLKMSSTQGQRLASDLEIVEFLQGVRRADLSLEITQKLLLAPSISQSGLLDKVLFRHARALNSVQKYSEAKEFYRRVFEQFPLSSLAAEARQRYLLTLLYAKENKNASVDAAKLTSQLPSKSVGRWVGLWSSYLIGDKKSFEGYAAKSYSLAEKARANYWRIRLAEKSAKAHFPISTYDKEKLGEQNSIYRLFADWRSGILKQKNSKNANEVRNKNKRVELGAKSLELTNLTDGDEFGKVLKEQKLLFSRLLKSPSAVSLLQSSVLLRGSSLWEFAGLVTEQMTEKIKVFSGDERALLRFALHDYHGVVKEISQRSTQAFGAPRLVGNFPASSQVADPKSRALWSLAYPLLYPNFLKSLSDFFNLPDYLIASVVRTESLYNPRAVSWVGARGLMQLMPATAQRIANELSWDEFDFEQLNEPQVNLLFGAWYLRYLLDHYSDSLTLAIAAYNAGPVAVDRWLRQTRDFLELDEFVENIPFDQTKSYVEKVLVAMAAYQRIYGNSAKAFQIVENEKLVAPKATKNLF